MRRFSSETLFETQAWSEHVDVNPKLFLCRSATGLLAGAQAG
jgi:hypothetical protein